MAMSLAANLPLKLQRAVDQLYFHLLFWVGGDIGFNEDTNVVTLGFLG